MYVEMAFQLNLYRQLMIIFSSFNYVALLHSTLANVSTPWRRGWGTMVAVVRWWPPSFIVFLQSASMVVVLCVTDVLIPNLEGPLT